MNRIRAVVVDPTAPARLALAEVDPPHPGPHEALVAVAATSLNRGDLLGAAEAPSGWRPGHDVAGTVVAAAADGTGPAAGDRVVGLLDTAAWADRVAAPTDRLAVLPDDVSFATAACLPTAGLTAHRAIEKGGALVGRRVLVTGSTGGVGLFAHQLARASGAVVVGTARQATHADLVRDLGADEVVTGDDLGPAAAFGPYQLVVESLGGVALAQAMGMTAAGGVCVSLGWSASPAVPLDLRSFLGVGGATVYALRMYHELTLRPASDDLDLLARMVADGRLRVPVEVERPWDEVSDVATRLLERSFTGKAVLRIGDETSG